MAKQDTRMDLVTSHANSPITSQQTRRSINKRLSPKNACSRRDVKLRRLHRTLAKAPALPFGRLGPALALVVDQAGWEAEPAPPFVGTPEAEAAGALVAGGLDG